MVLNDRTNISNVQLQTAELKKEIEELKQELNGDTVAHALREVKEYASRANELNVDTLQMKLMHLDEVARRTRHVERELYSMVLLRFLNHKEKRNVGFLVTSLLSSQAEARIFEKEQKFLKLYANDNVSTQDKSPNKPPPTPKQAESQSEDNLSTVVQIMQMLNGTAFRQANPRMPNFTPRRGGFAGPRPRVPYAYTGCYKCGDMSHLRIDCPKK